MNFLGMGPMEILMILLVAFIFLGPKRMVDAAKFLGKAAGEVRRVSAELPDLVLDEDEDEVERSAGPSARSTEPGAGDPTDDSQPRSTPQANERDVDGSGPVAFRPGKETATGDTAKPPGEQEQA